MFAAEGADVALVYLPEEQQDAEDTEKLIVGYGEWWMAVLNSGSIACGVKVEGEYVERVLHGQKPITRDSFSDKPFDLAGFHKIAYRNNRIRSQITHRFSPLLCFFILRPKMSPSPSRHP